MKKIVTVIVAGFALCLMFSLSCEAAATTKATTKAKAAKKAATVSKEKKGTTKNQTNNSNKKYTESDLRYMTSIIYCEARGESYAGQKAVGIVVMNRVRSKKFPNSVQEVIYQSGQFSPVRNGHLNKALKLYDKQKKKGKIKGAMETCMSAAEEALEGSTVIQVKGNNKQMKNYLFFSRYIRNAKYQLGAHQFK